MISSHRDDTAAPGRSHGAGKGAPKNGPVVGREPPHNLELERAVLAVLLDGRHATAMHKVRQQVAHPLAFFQRDHRIVYLACLELDDAGHRIDAQAVAELLSRYDFKAMLDKLRNQQQLLESDQLDGLGVDRLRQLWRRQEPDVGYEDSALAAIGGYNAIAELTESHGASSAGLERNVALLWDYHLKRRLITRLQALTDKAYRTPDEFPNLIDQGGQAMLELGRMTQSSMVYSLGAVVDETLDSIAHRATNPDEGVKTGIADLDDKLVALRPGGLYVLAARPGAGKTSLALNLVGNIARRPELAQGVLFFSLEVDRIDLVKKLLSAESGIDFRAIETGLLEPAQQEALYGAAQRFKDWRLDLMDVSDLNVSGLRSVVKRRMLESEGKLKLVVIDYLQLLGGTRHDMNEYEKVSEISRVLKVLARELRIPVLALSQMSRDSEKGVQTTPREPRLSDLRGSGTIEQDADAVIFIHRVDQPQDGQDTPCRKMKVVIAKNRFGPTGSVPMHFFPAKMLFKQAAREEFVDEDDSFDGAKPSRPQRRDKIDSKPGDGEDLFQ